MNRRYTMFGMNVVAINHVQALKGFSKESFVRPEDILSYIKEVATRVEVYSGAVVRTDTVDNFMEDMLTLKMIKITEITEATES